MSCKYFHVRSNLRLIGFELFMRRLDQTGVLFGSPGVSAFFSVKNSFVFKEISVAFWLNKQRMIRKRDLENVKK